MDFQGEGRQRGPCDLHIFGDTEEKPRVEMVKGDLGSGDLGKEKPSICSSNPLFPWATCNARVEVPTLPLMGSGGNRMALKHSEEEESQPRCWPTVVYLNVVLFSHNRKTETGSQGPHCGSVAKAWLGSCCSSMAKVCQALAVTLWLLLCFLSTPML